MENDYTNKLKDIIKLNNRLIKLKCSDIEHDKESDRLNTQSIRECKNLLNQEIGNTIKCLSSSSIESDSSPK